MFPCKRCGKVYQSQSSLSRHYRNHSLDHSRHVCPSCDVVFSRRDLLVRHMQIHEDAGRDRDNTSSPIKASSRRRCHTACQPCRRARVKCSGEQPCLSCMANQRDCRYATRSQRVSRIGPTTSDPTAMITPSTVASCGDGTPPGGHHRSPPTVTTNPDDAPQTDRLQPGGTSASVVEFSQGDREDCLSRSGLSSSLAVVDNSQDDVGALDDASLSWALDCLPSPVSWPWLHENLYLQGNAWDEWLGVFSNGSSRTTDAPASHTEQAYGADIQPDPAPDPPLPLPLTAPSLDAQGGGTDGLGMPRTAGFEPQLQDRPSCSQGPLPCNASSHTAQSRVVQEIVAYAKMPVTESSNSRLCYWQSMSLQVAHTFGIEDWQTANTEPTLLRMLHLYKENFSPLWPLLSGREFCPGELHPLLFVTLVSIGAMYGTAQERCFGTAAHEAIRPVLLTPLSPMEDVEDNLLPLGRARLLVQVAALYFGQRRAFTYAQHLGAIVVAQARCMELFSSHRAPLAIDNMSTENQLKVWMQLEARKRLAFGILRADVYTSVLMSSRPLLSAEEIDLTLPAPDHIWSATDERSMQRALEGVRADMNPWQVLPFCDLVRIALDRSEVLLEMAPSSYELLLFGLQEPVWRFSQDPHLFRRLTGTQELPDMVGSVLGRGRRSPDTLIDQLGTVHRRMTDLRDNRLQLTESLRKWEQSFAAVRTIERNQKDRTSIMSSLLLYNLSCLRLTAPLADLHSAAYAVSNRKPVENRKLHALHSWACGQQGRMAADFACQIWGLLFHETTRPVGHRAKHNLLAFSGLHHAAVVLWVFAGTQDEVSSELSLPASANGQPVLLCRRESTQILLNFVSLYKRLVPAEWCSFAAAAECLSRYAFPIVASNTAGAFDYENG